MGGRLAREKYWNIEFPTERKINILQTSSRVEKRKKTKKSRLKVQFLFRLPFVVGGREWYEFPKPASSLAYGTERSKCFFINCTKSFKTERSFKHTCFYIFQLSLYRISAERKVPALPNNKQWVNYTKCNFKKLFLITFFFFCWTTKNDSRKYFSYDRVGIIRLNWNVKIFFQVNACPYFYFSDSNTM